MGATCGSRGATWNSGSEQRKQAVAPAPAEKARFRQSDRQNSPDHFLVSRACGGQDHHGCTLRPSHEDDGRVIPGSYLGYHLLHVGSHLVFGEDAATLGESRQVAADVESVHLVAQRRQHPAHIHGGTMPAAVPGHEEDRRAT